MGTLTELILTTVVCLVAPLVTVCLPLHSRVCGTEIKSGSSLLGFQNASGRRFCSVRTLVWPAGARLDSAGSDRGGGGSSPRRARRVRAGGGLDGVAQRAVARGHSCPTLGCVRQPG